MRIESKAVSKSGWVNSSKGAVVDICDEQNQLRMRISLAEDVVAARLHARELARKLGFSGSQSMLVVTAVSELARNILRYAGTGEIVLLALSRENQNGVRITALDRGPGIENLAGVLTRSYSASSSTGLGLAALREIVDDFDIAIRVGGGVQVVTTIWS